MDNNFCDTVYCVDRLFAIHTSKAWHHGTSYWPGYVAADGPVELCTKLNAECDQQVTVVSPLLTALDHVHRSQVLLTSTIGLSHSVAVDMSWLNLLSPEF